MARCGKCGGRKRWWRRTCSRCRTGYDRAETAADAGGYVADAAELGVFRMIGHALAGFGRLIARILN
ncbi:hypothetical protein IHE55_29425 [Streptomyces pactum]|uniref:Uncharacterized protein n=1 Tax=Streptomyces pactum TaxID=68249 RepID=A0ABS0NTZ7_9ACTN|nr:hypothetical protein [Streptomyces pactum]MBH5338679.1 hypothetical protein [Streptomyces pactum]